MTRSHAHRAAPATIALVALALAGCGSAKEPAASTTAPPAGGGASSTTPAVTASASPTAAAGTGLDDPKTGLDGSQPGGRCSWVTAEQVGELASGPLKDPVTGTIVQQPLNGYAGTLRNCLFALGGKGDSMTVGTLAFDDAADVATFIKKSTDEGAKPVAGMTDAYYSVFKSPVNVGQSISVVDGTKIRYITARYQGDTAKIVKNVAVADTDRLPALKAMYAKVFG
ncbi:hypothetical protein [Oryzobacter terrae]|uniref:hypothetical protein n=1 Tax=Oryzobacter terrae TaxID=1620385 RepID=UPI00366AD2F0